MLKKMKIVCCLILFSMSVFAQSLEHFYDARDFSLAGANLVDTKPTLENPATFNTTAQNTIRVSYHPHSRETYYFEPFFESWQDKEYTGVSVIIKYGALGFGYQNYTEVTNSRYFGKLIGDWLGHTDTKNEEQIFVVSITENPTGNISLGLASKFYFYSEFSEQIFTGSQQANNQRREDHDNAMDVMLGIIVKFTPKLAAAVTFSNVFSVPYDHRESLYFGYEPRFRSTPRTLNAAMNYVPYDNLKIHFAVKEFFQRGINIQPDTFWGLLTWHFGCEYEVNSWLSTRIGSEFVGKDRSLNGSYYSTFNVGFSATYANFAVNSVVGINNIHKINDFDFMMYHGREKASSMVVFGVAYQP